MKKILAMTLFAVSLFAAHKNISIDEIKELQKSGAALVDIRTEGEWIESGVVSGSLKITSHDENRNLYVERFVENLKSAGIGIESKIILICRSGNRSLELAKKLESLGFEKIYNVQSGIKNWIREKRDLQKAY